MRKPLRPHREGPTIVGGGSKVILTVLYNEKESDLLGHPLMDFLQKQSSCNERKATRHQLYVTAISDMHQKRPSHCAR